MGLMRSIMVVLLAGALVACGSVETGTGNGLSLTATATGIKSLTFEWPAVDGATHYKLFVNPDGGAGYVQVGGDLATTSTVVSLPVHTTQWLAARYLVEAHDAGGVIATSASIGIAGLMLDTIGYAKASNTEFNDNFGYRVAVSGDGATLAVSASGEDSEATGIDGSQSGNSVSDAGAVYLFIRSGETWIQQAYIKASNTDPAQPGDGFGSSLALSSNGNTLAVGASGEDSDATGINGSEISNLASNAGAVYLFIRTGTAWSQQAYIKASNTDSGDNFGTSVALSGDGNTLAVGASGEDSAAAGIDGIEADNAAGNAGAVYLFSRSAALWSPQAYIKASNTASGDAFGGSIALSSDGNTLAVGAAGEDSADVGINGDESSDLANNAGAVYLFTRSGTAWSQQAYVKASNTDANDGFGGSVDLSGDGNSLAVGAAGEDSAASGIGGDPFADTADSAGAVYLFTRSGTVWSQQAYVKATNSEAFDNFGVSVALAGDGNILAVGASHEDSIAVGLGGDQDDNFAQNAGAVYLYTRTAGVWSAHSYVKAPNTDSFDIFGDNFGASIALSVDGNILAVGATGEDSDATGINGDMVNNNLGSAGAVYLY